MAATRKRCKMQVSRTVWGILMVSALFLAEVIFLTGQLRITDNHANAVLSFFTRHQEQRLQRQLQSELQGHTVPHNAVSGLAHGEDVANQVAPSSPSVAGARKSDAASSTTSSTAAPSLPKQTAATKKLKASTAEPAAKYDMVWGDGDQPWGNGFVRLAAPAQAHGRRVWQETFEGQKKYVFEEKAFTDDERSPQAWLYDPQRQIEVHLGDNKVQYKWNSMKKWGDLGVGEWTTIHGKKPGKRGHPAYQNGRPPPPQHSREQNSEVKIMILISAYHDKACGNTLHEAFLRAQYPDRIFIGVVDQYDASSPDCVEEYCRMQEDSTKCRRSQIKHVRVPMDHSRGVMPARYRQQLFVDDEEFCLQIDAHCMFEYNWDMVALDDWLLADNEMAVVTTYPHGVQMVHLHGTTPARCETLWGNGIIVDGVVADVRANPTGRPFLQPFFGAGIVFSKCHRIFNVPYDPYMPYMFKGEEFNQAVRLWTHGYDLYAPLRNYVFHFYDTEELTVKKFGRRTRDFVSMHTELKRWLQDQAELRWRLILGMVPDPVQRKIPALDDDLGIFGLGTRRSLEAYSRFAKVHFNNQTAVKQCNQLGKLQWVPYQYTDEPGNPFRPSGASCPAGESHKCCTNLKKSIAQATKMLSLTNDELWEDLKKRPRTQKPPWRPVYAAEDAQPGPCEALD